MLNITLITLITLMASTQSFASSIAAERTGDATVEIKPHYTLIKVPTHVTTLTSNSDGPDLSQKYVLLSNGSIDSPTINPPCQAMQVFQSAISQGDVTSVSIAVEALAANDGADCSDAVKQIVEAPNLVVTFRTALLGDGSGTDVGPITMSITK